MILVNGRKRTAELIQTCSILVIWGFSFIQSASGQVDRMADNRYYSFIYFDQGYPTRLVNNRRSQSMANQIARENPDVVVQTGFYTLRLDCDTLQLSGLDEVQGSDYLKALNEDVTAFTPVKMALRIEKDGTAYTCTSGVAQEKSGQNIRLIQSGQYVQRFDHTGLIFTDKFGNEMEGRGRLELTAWADHVVFQLDLTGVEGVAKTGIQIIAPSGKVYRAGGKGNRATLVLSPHLDQKFQSLDPLAWVAEAVYLRNQKKIKSVYDVDEQGLRFDLPLDPIKFPKDRDRLDEYVIELKNPTDEAVVLPLIFSEIQSRAITGTSMLLCDDQTGRPTGIPVQISKNWHNEKGHRVKHDGPWLRGYAMVPMKAGETRRLRLRLVTGFWAGVPAVSFSQLSVIGYGGNWKWDESALGCWGESMCYDPSQHLGSAFITDVRPAFTLTKKGTAYNWTENVGGGDFLIYFDKDNTYRWTKKMKTAYYWTGPNITEVHYSGITDDDAIRFTYRIRSVRTADYHRRFHSYTYNFLKDVETPQRLVFHQMAADYYNTVEFDRFYTGNETGMKKEHDRPAGLEGYGVAPIPFNDTWLVTDDTACNDREVADVRGRRGMLHMDSTLNGKPFPLFIHPFGRTRGGERINLDLSAESVKRSYKAGDEVRGELEFILPANDAAVYWGDDQEFAGRLKAYGSNPWKIVADEYTHNIKMDVSIQQGALLNKYPIEIQALKKSNVLADFTIQNGGIGHVPIILRGVPEGSALKAERFIQGKWVSLESVNIEENNYYQGIRNTNGMMDCLFNINRPTTDLEQSWRVRIISN